MPPKIYISYSWSPESSKIADIIDQDWQDVGISLTRDKRAVGYKTSLKEFMRSMSTGDYVLLIISKGYLESKNCMYEALELLQNPDFKEKVLPIIVPSANIHDAIGKLGYVKYWEDKINTVNNKIRELSGLSNLQSIYEELDHYTNIRISISKFIETVSDMRGSLWPDIMKLNYEEIKNQNYDEIFRYINYEGTHIIEKCRRILNIKDEDEQDVAIEKLIAQNANNLNNKYILFTRATIARRSNKYRRAKIILESLIPLNPVLAHQTLGIVLADNLKDHQAARMHFEQALKLAPEDATQYYNLAFVLAKEFSEYSLARDYYQHAIQLRPDYAEAHNNLSILLATHFGEKELALQHATEAVKSQPHNSEYRVNLGDLLLSQFSKGLATIQQLQSVRRQYHIALVHAPDQYRAHLGLGHLYGKYFQDVNSARQHFEQALVLEPENAIVLCELGKYLSIFLGKNLQAQKYLKKAIKLNPNLGSAHSGIGEVYIAVKNFKLAKIHFERALALEPNNAYAHLNLGILLTSHFDLPQEGRTHLEQALTLLPNDTEVNYNLGYFLLIYTKEHILARQYLEKTLEIQPYHVSAHHTLACMLRDKLNDPIMAKEHFKQSVILEPGTARLHFDLGNHLVKYFEDEYGLAREHYEKAVALESGNPYFHFALAILLTEKFENHVLAREHLEKAIKIKRDYAKAKIRLKLLIDTHFKKNLGANNLRKLLFDKEKSKKL